MPAQLSDDAFRDLYVACAPLAFRRARGLLGTDADAWDAVQEVFCKLAENGLIGSAQERPMAYVYRATTNACLNILEKMRTRADARLEVDHLDRGAAETLHARDLLLKLDKQLDALDRQILVLAFHDDLPQEQIAEALGIWRRTVGRRLSRLRGLVEELQRAPLQRTP